MAGDSRRGDEQARRMQLKYQRREFGVGDAVILVPAAEAHRCPRCGGSGMIDDFEQQVALSNLGHLAKLGWLMPVMCPTCHGRG